MNTPMPRDVAVERLTRYLTEGRAKSESIVKSLAEETAARVDLVVPRTMMHFQVDPERIQLAVNTPDHRMPDPLDFTEWSRGQMLGTLGVQQRFIDGLQKDGATGAAIATDLLNDLRYRIGGEEESNGKARRLLRVVRQQVRGWLSPTYGMFDQGEILQGFNTAIHSIQKDVVFTEGNISDRRYGLSAVWAKLLEPFPGEFVLMGAQLQSSDYGFGALDLVQHVIRLVCRNGMLGVSFFHKVHKGGILAGNDNAVFEISERTRHLSAQTVISMLTDGVSSLFSDKAVDAALVQYQKAAVREINPESEATKLYEKGVLNREDANKVPTLLAMDLEVLPDTPAKNSALRLSQLLAWMGGQTTGENQFNLMEAAGKYSL